MTAHQRSSSREQLSARVANWSQFLSEETHRIDATGVGAALVSVRLGSTNDRIQRQVAALFGRLLAPTDTFHVNGTGMVTILIAPTPSIATLSARVAALQSELAKLGTAPVLGYALRRSGESLLDTLARSDASTDRAQARRESSASVLVLSEDSLGK